MSRHDPPPPRRPAHEPGRGPRRDDLSRRTGRRRSGSFSALPDTQQILAKIDRLLAEAGSDKSNILAATVWLADVSRFDEMNEVWDAWGAPGRAPARATVQAALARPRNLVEIMVVAAEV